MGLDDEALYQEQTSKRIFSGAELMTVGLYFPDFQGDFQTELLHFKSYEREGKSMKANIKWLDDPQVFRVNQSNAHSDHVCYATREEVETTSSLKQSLNGSWRFVIRQILRYDQNIL